MDLATAQSHGDDLPLEACYNPILPRSPRPSDFTVIWQNLTYKVNTASWFARLRRKVLNSSDYADASSMVGSTDKVILNRICGDIKSRQLTAIMGPSGAGKSTLLYCLFQNRRLGVSGRIMVESKTKSKLKVCFIPQNDYLNEWLTVREDLIFVSKLKSVCLNRSNTDGSSKDSDKEGRKTSYVKHDRSSKSSSVMKDHELNAIRVAELLGLETCLDVQIKNISGGQKKRLSVARELMSKPDILVLDEPTTGLDSVTCYKTIKVLSELAHNSSHPMAILVTIHQPEKSVFNLFDKSYFLSRTGSVIYDGQPRQAVKTMKEVANIELPSPKYNPAAFIIEVASNKTQDSLLSRLAEHQRANFHVKFSPSLIERLMQTKFTSGSTNWNFCTTKQNCDSLYSHESPKGAESRTSFDSIRLSSSEIDQPVEEKSGSPKRPDASEDSNQNEYYISMQLSNCLSSHTSDILQSFRHVFVLTHRSWLSFTRNPTFTRSRLIFHTLLPFIMLGVFGIRYGSPNNCPKVDGQFSMADISEDVKSGVIAENVEDTRLSLESMSFFFILLYGFAINIISSTASYYPMTLQMFKKERINGLYSAPPYFIGQMLAELPFEMFFPMLSIFIYYPLSGQISSFMEWRLLAVSYVVFLVSYSIHSMGLLSGSIFTSNVSVAVLFGQVALLPHVMLSGFVVRYSRMSEWMRKLAYASVFRQGITGIAVARYGFGVCDCDPETIEPNGIEGMKPNVRHVLEYMFPSNQTGDEADQLPVSDIFDKMAAKFAKVQSMGMDIKTCDDVRPYVMHIFSLQDSDIFVSIISLILLTSLFKLAAFYFMKSYPYRIS